MSKFFNIEKITTTNIIAIIAIIISLVLLGINIFQYSQNKNYKEKIDRYSSLTNTFNFNLDISEHFESISLITDSGTKNTEIPLPSMKIQTGFPASRTLYIVYDNSILDARTLPTGTFIVEIDYKDDISDFDMMIGVDDFPCINLGDGNYGGYFFVVTEGMDGSRKIHAINYVFEQDSNDTSILNYKSGKVYEREELMKDFDDNTNMALLKNDFDYLYTKLDYGDMK